MFYRRIYIGFHCLWVLTPHLHDIYFGYHDFSTAHGQLYDIPALKLAICRELGITEDKVNIILRTTEEGTDEKTGV